MYSANRVLFIVVESWFHARQLIQNIGSAPTAAAETLKSGRGGRQRDRSGKGLAPPQLWGPGSGNYPGKFLKTGANVCSLGHFTKNTHFKRLSAYDLNDHCNRECTCVQCVFSFWDIC